MYNPNESHHVSPGIPIFSAQRIGIAIALVLAFFVLQAFFWFMLPVSAIRMASDNITNSPAKSPVNNNSTSSNLYLSIIADPPADSEVTAGDQIHYLLMITNRGDITNTVTITVNLPSHVMVQPSSITPPTATMISAIREGDGDQAEGRTLLWQEIDLSASESLSASFTVYVINTLPVLVQAQAGIIGDPTIALDITHPVQPTNDEESQEPTLPERLFLPLVTR